MGPYNLFWKYPNRTCSRIEPVQEIGGTRTRHSTGLVRVFLKKVSRKPFGTDQVSHWLNHKSGSITFYLLFYFIR